VKSRVSPTDPFAVTGVDFTGALYVTTSDGEGKVYLCLFTCAVSRAIHLEIVSDLSVESFLLAFRRFVGRRSVPKFLISDNGSTYLAAAEDLKSLFLYQKQLPIEAPSGNLYRSVLPGLVASGSD